MGPKSGSRGGRGLAGRFAPPPLSLVFLHFSIRNLRSVALSALSSPLCAARECSNLLAQRPCLPDSWAGWMDGVAIAHPWSSDCITRVLQVAVLVYMYCE